jgi:hypothetical protein
MTLFKLWYGRPPLQQTPYSVLAIATSSSALALASALPGDNVPDQEYLFSELY